MTATGELLEQLHHIRNLVQRALDELDEGVKQADRLDDDAINAADIFVTDHRNTGRPA